MRIAIWSIVAVIFLILVRVVFLYTDPLQFYRDTVNETVAEVQSEIRRAQELQAARERARVRTRDYDLHYEAGLKMQEEEKYDKAILHYDEAIKLWNVKHDAHCRKMECLNSLERYQETLAIRYRSNRNPNCPTMRSSRGKALEALGEHAEAIAEYQDAIKYNPESTILHNNLAWLLAGCIDETFTDGTKALYHAQTVAELRKQNPDCSPEWISLALLGAAHSRTGDFEEAIELTEQAIPIAPQSEHQRLEKVLASYREGLPYQREPEAEPALQQQDIDEAE